MRKNTSNLFKFTLGIVFILILFLKPISKVEAQGTRLDQWVDQQVLPYTVASHQVGIYKNKIFLFGGAGKENGLDVGHNEILSTFMDDTGNLGPWSILPSSLPLKLLWHSVVINENHVYLLGGANVNSPSNVFSTSTVYLGTINEEGTDISWESMPSLPKALSNGGAFIYKDNIYYLGGYTKSGSGFIFNRNIYRAEIDDNGSITQWQLDSSIPLSQPQAEFSMFLNSNKLILLGGTNTPGLIPLNGIYHSEIQEDGSLSGWTNDGVFVLPIRRPSFGLYKGYYFIAGGIISNSLPFSKQTYYSKADLNGLPTNWEISSELLPTNNCCGPLLGMNNTLYIFGGHSYDGQVYSYESQVLRSKLRFGPLELPFNYPGRGGEPEDFKLAFNDRVRSYFDHEFAVDSFVLYDGTQSLGNCDSDENPTPQECYDSHNGMDFSSIKGEEVLSAGEGEVAYVSVINEDSCEQEKSGFGCIVIVKHQEDLYTMYAHLKKVNVVEGNFVTENSILGNMGNTGCGNCKQHLHFSVLSPNNQILSSLTRMTKEDWKSLVNQIPSDHEKKEKKFPYKHLKPFCSVKAGNGLIFNFTDPNGWSGDGVDPWSKSVEEGGCGVTNSLLWKYDTSIN